MTDTSEREPFYVQCGAGCGRVYTMEINRADYAAWKNGQHVQNAFPYLTPNQRELLLTNTCGHCWDRMFPPEDQ